MSSCRSCHSKHEDYVVLLVNSSLLLEYTKRRKYLLVVPATAVSIVTTGSSILSRPIPHYPSPSSLFLETSDGLSVLLNFVRRVSKLWVGEVGLSQPEGRSSSWPLLVASSRSSSSSLPSSLLACGGCGGGVHPMVVFVTMTVVVHVTKGGDHGVNCKSITSAGTSPFVQEYDRRNNAWASSPYRGRNLQ
jgi:hypothetical protein